MISRQSVLHLKGSLRNAIGEILSDGIPIQIRKRQHRQRGLRKRPLALDRRDEAVASAGERLDIPGGVCLVAQSGVFAFKDSWPAKRLGTKRLECVLTIRGGEMVYQREPVGARGGDTTIYDVLLKHARIGDRPDEVDIGIAGNRIVRVGRGLKAAHARVVVEAEGYAVTPATAAAGMAADLRVLDGGRAIMVIRSGKIVTDDEGLTIPDTTRAGPYSNFK